MQDNNVLELKAEVTLTTVSKATGLHFDLGLLLTSITLASGLCNNKVKA